MKMKKPIVVLLVVLAIIGVTAIGIAASRQNGQGQNNNDQGCRPGSTCRDDGNPCTNDICNPNGECVHPYNTASCAGGAGQCTSGKCVCSDTDGTVCTTETYDKATNSCKTANAANGAACTDSGGEICSNGQCVANDCGGTCNEFQQCCGGSCINMNDPNNCFACGNACANGQICDAENGNPGDLTSCVDCTTLVGKVECTVHTPTGDYYTCADLSSDPYHCGDCNRVCNPDGATPVCNNGVCSCTDASCVANGCFSCGTDGTCIC